MANNIVKDSLLSIFVKQVQVAASGTADASVPKVNDLFAQGAIVGLVGARARKGEDGAFYSTIDTAAEIRVDGVSGAFTVGQPVYRASSGGAPTGTSTGNGTPIGYAAKPKVASGAGSLIIQLVPRAIA